MYKKADHETFVRWIDRYSAERVLGGGHSFVGAGKKRIQECAWWHSAYKRGLNLVREFHIIIGNGGLRNRDVKEGL